MAFIESFFVTEQHLTEVMFRVGERYKEIFEIIKAFASLLFYFITSYTFIFTCLSIFSVVYIVRNIRNYFREVEINRQKHLQLSKQ